MATETDWPAASASSARRLWVAGLALLAVAIGAGAWWWSASRGPQPGSRDYEALVTAFHRGLAALEVGLLDDARDQFTRATTLAPHDAATWANLGLTQLRRGDLEQAAPAIDTALALAPQRSDVLMLAARLASARGDVESGVALLRRATEANPDDVRARFALIEEIERAGTTDGGDDLAALLDALAARTPGNLAVIVERVRLAARTSDAVRAQEAVLQLQAQSSSWPSLAREQLTALGDAVRSRQWADAARAAALLRNVLARVPAFAEGLGAVRTAAELVSLPIQVFASLPAPDARPAPPDTTLTFTAEPTSDTALWPQLLYRVDETRPVLARVGDDGLRVDAGAALGAWPAGAAARGATFLDWNHDFRMDLALAGQDGVRLLLQSDTGGFADATPAGPDGAVESVTGLWSADIEMDGDLDLVGGVADGPVRVLRNNGDGTWQASGALDALRDVRRFAWADLDGDGDPDAAALDGAGRVHVAFNQQAGRFLLDASTPAAPAVAFDVADLGARGTFDLVLLSPEGRLSALGRASDGRWTPRALGTIDGGPFTGEAATLVVADFDNNGALDVLAGGTSGAGLSLGTGGALSASPVRIEGRVVGAADLNGDGLLDLFGTTGGRVARWVASAQAGYRSKTIRVRAQQNAGDQRINSFGLGGDVEVRSGLLWQKQPIRQPVLHVGVGRSAGIDVARIVWPNGVPQAEFDVSLDGPLVAEQRLKGSCPWVFAHNGRDIVFVTDFLWRSPLGLRINAQDTAGVSQTEDWVRVSGDQLRPVDGAYDLRITAELWETHFFDHVSLLVVDHPADTEMFVDERFSAGAAPVLEAQIVRGLTPVTRAEDETGADVTSLVVARDGRYLATFPKGAYQGIAREHFVEFQVPPPDAGAPRVLIAQGWVYPTDSSINVALGQGRTAPPRGLALEAFERGRWRVVSPDLGFPAGKNKTLVVDLSAVPTATRLRLRTNLEVYWDALGVAARVAADVRTSRLAAAVADLRYRGFSVTRSPRGEAPETPLYGQLASVSQRWRDLEGYYTRFGDVRALLASVDDRYVIMNAGDELRLRFPEQPPVAEGWRRDFVLVGDGWEKDGDYNTGQSTTVLPLPEHAVSDYGRVPASPLEDDPVYRRHPEDWEHFHTRYVTAGRFAAALRPR